MRVEPEADPVDDSRHRTALSEPEDRAQLGHLRLADPLQGQVGSGTEGPVVVGEDGTIYVAWRKIHDGSVRDWQGHSPQFTPGKNFSGTGGFGPWMVTADEIPDPTELHLQTRLNGEVVQDTDVSLLIASIPRMMIAT